MPFRDKIDEYRAKAAELRDMASQVLTLDERQMLLDSAADWERAAKEIEIAYDYAAGRKPWEAL